jgi:hypothetical protein
MADLVGFCGVPLGCCLPTIGGDGKRKAPSIPHACERSFPHMRLEGLAYLTFNVSV